MRSLMLICRRCSSVLILLIFLVFLVPGFSPVYEFSKPRPFSGPDIYNPYSDLDTAISWKRANFHTHTKVDGLFNECPEYPDSVYADYMRLGYDIVAFSNHNELTDFPGEDSLAINVYEHGYNLFKFHKLVFNPSRVNRYDNILPLFVSQKQFEYDLLLKDADFIVMNHPDRTNHTTARSLSLLTGYRFIEGDSGKSTELKHWDEALSAGHYSHNLADDDCHNSDNHSKVAIRCNWLNTPSRSYEDVKSTLLKGCFYSMRVPDFGAGDWSEKYSKNKALPSIMNISLVSDTITLTLSEKAEEITVYGQNHRILARCTDTSSAEYRMAADDSYARFTARFTDGTIIYTNAFARYDSKETDTPFKVSEHKVNIWMTVLFNLALALILSLGILASARLWGTNHKGSSRD